jgi:hypothetical protein
LDDHPVTVNLIFWHGQSTQQPNPECALVSSVSAWFDWGVTTLREILVGFMGRLAAAGVESPRLNAELILGHALGVDRAGVRGMLHTVPDPAQVAETPSNTRAWLCR